MAVTDQDTVVEQQFTAKERDAESGLDYFPTIEAVPVSSGFPAPPFSLSLSVPGCKSDLLSPISSRGPRSRRNKFLLCVL